MTRNKEIRKEVEKRFGKSVLFTNPFKKCIKKYLKKRLTGHPKHYHFLRWLVELVIDKEQNNDVCCSIARWMYDTRHSDLPFHDIFTIDNNVYIYTYRPGLWIGNYGSIVEDCQKSINHNIYGDKIHDYEIRFIEVFKTPYTVVFSYMRSYADNW